jgi:xylan 1,4-beta-xylosidase
VEILRLPAAAGNAKAEEFRVDGQNSNSYATWQKMGSPQNPTTAAYAKLEAAGRLMKVGTPQLTQTAAGGYAVTLELPQQSVSLVRLRW